jgi:hypothetical protein
MKTNLEKPLKAAAAIGQAKTKEGKRKAILNWCRVMKEALRG